MISLHTNISSLITQNNMTTSTNKLNTAIERMSTGSKINHASDNAANYSIATDMSSHISAYNVAADNIAMGVDLLNVAQETISQMQSKAGKLHALITQARNGTYGTSSIDAINKEASAIIAEINRAYKNAEYDGIGMIQKFKPELSETAGLVKDITPKANGFIADIVEETPDIIVSSPDELEDAINTNSKIGIANAETLVELAKIVNGTAGYTANDCTGKTIILTDNIDLSDYNNWETMNEFKGNFNGNGHKILNLKITKTNNANFITTNSQITIKNVGFENVDIKATKPYAGIFNGKVSLENCYSTGKVSGTSFVGGLGASITSGNILNCYSTCDVSSPGGSRIGGLIGNGGTNVENCFYNGNVQAAGAFVGGLISDFSGNAYNCYSSGTVNGGNSVGGLFGCKSLTGLIKNCYSTASVECADFDSGGLIGRINAGTVTSCYATGNVKGYNNVGGLIGKTKDTTNVSVSDVYSTGNITAESDNAGGLIGYVGTGLTLENAQTTSIVYTKAGSAGGAFGTVASATSTISKAVNLSNISIYGEASGGAYSGSVIGTAVNTLDDTLTPINITNCKTTDDNFVGRVCKYSTSTSSYENIDFDTSVWDFRKLTIPVTKITLQTGLYSANTSQISFDLGFDYDLDSITADGCASENAYNAIMTFINTLGEKETELGAITNRLDSALESVYVSMDNLVSSRSTIQDADMSKVSSDFIRQQILQQACATLMSTANQSPAIALQLI